MSEIYLLFGGVGAFIVVIFVGVAVVGKRLRLRSFQANATGPAGTGFAFSGETAIAEVPSVEGRSAGLGPLGWLDEIAPVSPAELQKAAKYRTFDAGQPPTTDVWFGREPELGLLASLESGVVAVTGVGGQGKSSFAARALESMRAADPKLFWDWRDARETGERFETQLISIIVRLTRGQVSGQHLVSADAADVIRLFFRLVRDIRAAFVFDNVDHYVDVDRAEFIGSFGQFVSEAIRSQSRIMLLVTCRPAINYPSLRFREIPLKGLTTSETRQLFLARHVKRAIAEGGLVPQLERITRGHPFWLNMLSLQLARAPESADTIIENLTSFHERELDRPVAILKPTWDILTPDHHSILRVLAEFTRPVTQDRVHSVLASKVSSAGQFHRKFRTLVSSGLVIEKRAVGSEPAFELHPLMAQFVGRMFAASERREMTLIVCRSCDHAITIAVSNERTGLLDPALLEDCVMSVDLALRLGDVKEAARMCSDLQEPLSANGLLTEYARVANDVLAQVDWSKLSHADEEFQDFAEETIAAFALLGRQRDVRSLEKLATPVVPPSSARYVGWCAILCHAEWTLRNFPEAISWGREVEALKEKSDIDTRRDVAYSLNLAIRDNGDPGTALSYFLAGRDVPAMLGEDYRESGVGAPQYGNIGRCLHLLGRREDALEFYLRSAELLFDDYSATGFLNRGWAGLWIAGLLVELGDREGAELYMKWATSTWSTHAPVHLKQLADLQDALGSPATAASDAAGQADLAARCLQDIQRRLRRPRGSTPPESGPTTRFSSRSSKDRGSL